MYDTERNGSSPEITEPTGPVEDTTSNPDIAQASADTANHDSVQPETVQAKPSSDATRSDADRNFEQLRLQKKRLEQERDSFARKVAEYEGKAAQQQKPEPEAPSLADDDLVEWVGVCRGIGPSSPVSQTGVLPLHQRHR